MSLELWNTFATFGTFLVIAATAVAAIVQLRHMRGSNQIAALSALYEKSTTSEFLSARHFIFAGLQEKMQDQAFRYQVVHRAARTEENARLIEMAIAVGNFHEEMGLLVKSGLINRDLFGVHGQNIVAHWNAILEFTAIGREVYGPILLENFEYITVLSQDWMNKWRGADQK